MIPFRIDSVCNAERPVVRIFEICEFISRNIVEPKVSAFKRIYKLFCHLIAVVAAEPEFKAAVVVDSCGCRKRNARDNGGSGNNGGHI